MPKYKNISGYAYASSKVAAIHKTIDDTHIVYHDSEALCGQFARNTELYLEEDWDKVTCKACLRKKKERRVWNTKEEQQ